MKAAFEVSDKYLHAIKGRGVHTNAPHVRTVSLNARTCLVRAQPIGFVSNESISRTDHQRFVRLSRLVFAIAVGPQQAAMAHRRQSCLQLGLLSQDCMCSLDICRTNLDSIDHYSRLNETRLKARDRHPQIYSRELDERGSVTAKLPSRIVFGVSRIPSTY